MEFSHGELLEADDTLPTTHFHSTVLPGEVRLNHETHETHETPSFRYYLESSDAIPLDDDIRVPSCPFVVQSIRAHSCPFVVLVFLFVYFVWFVVQSFRALSCTFVVLNFLFVYFVSIRGSTHSCPFVSIRGSDFSFRVFRVFRGSIHSCPFVASRPVSEKNKPPPMFF